MPSRKSTKSPRGRTGRSAYRAPAWSGRATPEAAEEGDCLEYKWEFCRKFAGSRRRSYARALHDLAAVGVLGLGFGAKIVEKDNRIAEERCVRVYVRRKLAKSRLTRRQQVPPEINGLPTDVIALPDLRPSAVPCGSITGYNLATAGTIGCVVERGGRRFILSNNHVLANSNAAQRGDPIRVPALGPGPVARLADFKPLEFAAGSVNDMDAAVAELVDPAAVDARIRLIGSCSAQFAPPGPGLPVQKTGITTDLRSGRIEAYSEDLPLPYPGGIAHFVNQFAVRGIGLPFSDSGDSGALVVTVGDRRPVGLLFGSAPLKGLSFCTPIERVLDYFRVNLVTG